VIWNDEYLFLHYPKAAGKSLTSAFLKSWRTPVCAYISKGQLAELTPFIKLGSTLWVHGAHQNLDEAATILKRMDRDIEKFRAIFVSVRCPYDLVYSTYKFHRANAKGRLAPPQFSFAANRNFDEFASQATFLPYRRWLSFGNKDLANLRVIRFEKMAKDFGRYAKEFGFKNVKIPHLNATPGPNYLESLAPATEKVIFEKFKVLFENGYYSRLLMHQR
jgi:hypothetical protein